jgi:hypothetical protein
MRNQHPDFSLAREKALYCYISAFERGDFEEMDRVLQQAMFDPLLDEMIMQAHEYYQAEEKIALREEDFAKIRQLVMQHLPSGIPDEDEAIDIPPLTVSDVFDKLQEDRTVQGSLKQEVQQIRSTLGQGEMPLPENLAIKNIYRFFEQLGVAMSARLQKLFREKAIFLSMARQQGIAQLAATRRQKAQYQPKQAEENKDNEHFSR